jgi:serine/threonine protein kinase/tetratricopeptide (TPR) repeat protein
MMPGMDEKNLLRGTTEICATCGRPMTRRGPNGECLRCLVNLAVAPDRKPARPSSRRVMPGTLRYAHFEVEVGEDGFPVELGAGAMAITYRARDTVLDSTVALKVIDRKVAEIPAVRSRFLREARAAAQLHHPNVAQVTHYGEQDGECFYVMELVDGETLESWVRRNGPMPLALALEVTEQAARALAAAEACGVVHRDIKPSNLMIASRQGESEAGDSLVVKVIDYGVAKVMAGESEIGADPTHAGFVGTPAFASPEQFAGTEQTAVDTRSDIYSLGVTLWYLLCARTPFGGRTLEEIRAKQASALPLEQLKAAHVPPSVAGLLKSMLAIDPANRPQSARELLAAVRRCYLRFEPQTRSRRKRFVITAALSTVVIAAIALGMWWYARTLSSAEIERSIAVLPFENLSPDSDEAFFTVGMQEEITAELARLAGMKVIGAQSTRSYLPGHGRNLPAIGRELGVRHLLEGSVWRANGEMRVSLSLVDLRDNAHPWTEAYARPIKDVFALQSEITRAVAARLQTRLSVGETTALEIPPTTDLVAYDLYLRAGEIDKLVKDVAERRSTTQRKIPLLEQAITRDPKFVLAYCRLANAHDVLYFERAAAGEDRSFDHRALAEAALEKARRLQPDAGPVHLALAQHFFSANNDPEQARIQVDLARRTMPNNSELEATAGTIARTQGRGDEAVRCFEKAVALEPRENIHRFTLANTHRLLRHYDDFDRLMAEVIGMMPAKDSLSYSLFRAVGSLESRGDLAPLRATLNAAPSGNKSDESLRDLYGIILGLADHDPDAVLRILARATNSSFVINGVSYPKTWFEGLAARMGGDDAAAKTAFSAARLEVEKAVRADATDGRTLGLLAMIDAGLGRPEEAVREAQQACDLEPFEISALAAPIVRCNLGVVYAWSGQLDLAIAELDKLVGKAAGTSLPAQPTYGDLRLNPVWDPLRRDRRFTAVTERLTPTTPK